jgi:hypothetical protein
MLSTASHSPVTSTLSPSITRLLQAHTTKCRQQFAGGGTESRPFAWGEAHLRRTTVGALREGPALRVRAEERARQEGLPMPKADACISLVCRAAKGPGSTLIGAMCNEALGVDSNRHEIMGRQAAARPRAAEHPVVACIMDPPPYTHVLMT